jgi:hypothetical protein
VHRELSAMEQILGRDHPRGPQCHGGAPQPDLPIVTPLWPSQRRL